MNKKDEKLHTMEKRGIDGIKHYKAILFLIVSALLFALNIIFNKIGLMEGVEPLTFASLRPPIIILTLFLVSQTKIRSELNFLSPYLKYLVLLGVIGYGLGPIALFFGQQFTTAVNAGFLLQTQPVFVVILAAILFGDKIGKGDVLSILMLIIGAYLIMTDGTQLIPRFSDILIVFTALFYGIEATIAKIPMRKISPVTTVMFGYIFGGLLIFIVWSFTSRNLPLMEQFIWIVLSSLCIGFSMVFYYEGIRSLGAGYSTVLLSLLSVLFTVILSFVLLGEMLTDIQIFGAMILMVGVALLAKHGTVNA
ncbi:MAG: EamA-like transporter family protein [Candidatus Syntrophoarchaeum sp. GoM_oil]|nr:MAG: EamA-like transporter family protein [Candidatus Syntrophoarchaeum sp. GoM_oil]